jgi:hypothetical protein
MKGGMGISHSNKEVIYDSIRESNIEIAVVEIGHQHEQQQNQQPPPEEGLALHNKTNNNLLQKMTYLMK